jgi:RimJ/RimL family protein N-acetyltransferase
VTQVLLVHDDQRIAEWARERIPHIRETGFGACTAFGVLQDGALVGAVVFNNYRGFDIHMSAVLDAPLTRQSLRTLCEYAFGQLNVRRVTSITGKKNRKARRALRIIGFTEEGTCKHALDGKSDAVVYGLLRENCKWIT